MLRPPLRYSIAPCELCTTPHCTRYRTELAKKYCQSAYRIDRYDKYLFLVWPRVEAALGDRVKARLLFERGLDAHPMNTKIMNVRTDVGHKLRIRAF